MIPFFGCSVLKFGKRLLNVEFDVFWSGEEGQHVLFHCFFIRLRESLLKFMEERKGILLDLVFLLLEHLFHFELLLHLRLEGTINKYALPFVSLLVSEDSIAMHLMINPLTLVNLSIIECISSYPVMFIIKPWTRELCSRLVSVGTLTLHLILKPLSCIFFFLWGVLGQSTGNHNCSMTMFHLYFIY